MKDKLIDLHTHTKFSDGELSPTELIDLAIKNNVGTIAITDHNTTNGLKGLDKERYKGKIKIVDGIELSASCDSGRMHILGYDIDPYNDYLNQRMEEQEDYSFNKIITIIEQIKRDYNITIQKDDFVNIINSKHTIGRPDIATLCVKYGYANDIEEAFQKYLNPAYYKTKAFNKRLSYEECFEIIKRSGGLISLAHPITLKKKPEEFKKLVKDMKACGLDAIEVYHSNQSEEERDFYLQTAIENNLLVSGGSDYHGPIKKPNIMIGTGRNNNLNIKELSLARKLK